MHLIVVLLSSVIVDPQLSNYEYASNYQNITSTLLAIFVIFLSDSFFIAIY